MAAAANFDGVNLANQTSSHRGYFGHIGPGRAPPTAVKALEIELAAVLVDLVVMTRQATWEVAGRVDAGDGDGGGGGFSDFSFGVVGSQRLRVFLHCFDGCFIRYFTGSMDPKPTYKFPIGGNDVLEIELAAMEVDLVMMTRQVMQVEQLAAAVAMVVGFYSG
ncbi:hypothetical protein CRG98_047466 [Punica granatum]|uniref:Uncharacterized protein n=1 Tax=Punica granatum TaxID=22663 RepID=A0A2I0HKD9_PUNGR|nr:hypothetical protein CRG98_047466 [Punica granatum]